MKSRQHTGDIIKSPSTPVCCTIHATVGTSSLSTWYFSVMTFGMMPTSWGTSLLLSEITCNRKELTTSSCGVMGAQLNARVSCHSSLSPSLVLSGCSLARDMGKALVMHAVVWLRSLATKTSRMEQSSRVLTICSGIYPRLLPARGTPAPYKLLPHTALLSPSQGCPAYTAIICSLHHPRN